MHRLRGGVISPDQQLWAALRESDRMSLEHEIGVAATEVQIEQLQDLDELGLDLIVVDLSDDPELSLRLVEHLVGSVSSRPVLVAGPPPSTQMLLDAMRAGVEEYLEKPLSAEALEAALERVKRRFATVAEAKEPRRQGCVYAFMGAKGGVGTTMVASNVAVALHQLTGRRVLLLDLDFGLGDAALHLGRTPRYDVVDVIENLHRLDAGLVASLVDEYKPDLHVLASPSSRSRIETVEPGQVQQAVQILRDLYSYIVIDAPHPFSGFSGGIITEADRVFLVATPEVSALRNVEHVLELLRQQGDRGAAHVQLLVNRFESARSVPATEIERLVGIPVRDTIGDDYESTTKSINEGRPVVLAQRTAIARDLRRLAASLVEVASDSGASRASAQRGLLRSLRRLSRNLS